VHNLDVINWVMNAHPLKAQALGGRQARTEKKYGHIYDHFAVEFEYPGGARLFSQCRQINHCEGNVEEAVVGEKGSSNCQNWIRPKAGPLWRFRDKDVNAYQQEHADFIASIRRSQPLNEATVVAESTLTAIMGRESAYSGRSIEWDEALNAKTRLGPEQYALGSLPFPDVAIPGQYQFT
jgi:predicted dehydrogenase